MIVYVPRETKKVRVLQFPQTEWGRGGENLLICDKNQVWHEAKYCGKDLFLELRVLIKLTGLNTRCSFFTFFFNTQEDIVISI